MAYRLRKNESISGGLRRAVVRELTHAVKRLSGAEPSAETIHEVRKTIKKVRTVLQLLRLAIATRRDRKHLRRASRLLSPLRDADVMLTTAKVFCGHGRHGLSGKACAALGGLLHRHKERVWLAAQREHAARRAAKALEHIRRGAKDWPWKKAEFDVLVAEIRRSYKKARREMGAARDGGRAVAFHEWRKRVKTLWYALRLLEERWPRRRLLSDLERVETWLGEDHNLLTFRTHALTHDGLPPSARGAVKALTARRQRQLRRLALALGERVFSATPKAFIQHLRQPRQKRHDGAHRARRRARSSPHRAAR